MHFHQPSSVLLQNSKVRYVQETPYLQLNLRDIGGLITDLHKKVLNLKTHQLLLSTFMPKHTQEYTHMQNFNKKINQTRHVEIAAYLICARREGADFLFLVRLKDIGFFLQIQHCIRVIKFFKKQGTQYPPPQFTLLAD